MNNVVMLPPTLFLESADRLVGGSWGNLPFIGHILPEKRGVVHLCRLGADTYRNKDYEGFVLTIFRLNQKVTGFCTAFFTLAGYSNRICQYLPSQWLRQFEHIGGVFALIHSACEAIAELSNCYHQLNFYNSSLMHLSRMLETVETKRPEKRCEALLNLAHELHSIGLQEGSRAALLQANMCFRVARCYAFSGVSSDDFFRLCAGAKIATTQL